MELNNTYIYIADKKDVPIIQSLAEKTWWPTYTPIVPAEQIRYMLDEIYSSEALEEVMENGSQTFLIIKDEHGEQGFASFGMRKEDKQIFKLHKIYILPENHGKGYGKMLLTEIYKHVLQLGGSILDLNVKRDNPAKAFYERLGFQVIREEDVPIGPYWMKDFVMRVVLKTATGL